MTKLAEVNVCIVREIAAKVLEKFPEENEDSVEKYLSYILAKEAGDEILATQDVTEYFEDLCDLPQNVCTFCDYLAQTELGRWVN